MKLPKFPPGRGGAPTPADRKPQRAPTGMPPASWPPRRMWLIFLLVLGVNFIVTRFLSPGEESVVVPYTVFKEQVLRNNVESIYSRGAGIEGRFIKAVTYPAETGNASNPNVRRAAP